MALELASKSVIFHQKLEKYDQIIDLAPSGVLLHPSFQERPAAEIFIFEPKNETSPTGSLVAQGLSGHRNGPGNASRPV